MEQLGAGSGAERVETLPESALELVGSHGWRLRRCSRRSLARRARYERSPRPGASEHRPARASSLRSPRDVLKDGAEGRER